MKRNLIILLSSLIFISALGYVYLKYNNDIELYFLEKRIIYWSTDNQIRISDFQGKPIKDSDLNIDWDHGFYINFPPIKEAKAYAFFNKSKSWVKDTLEYGLSSELKMQKLHFDIHELYTRKLNHQIRQIRNNEQTKYEDITFLGSKIEKEISSAIDSLYVDKNLSDSEIIEIWSPLINELLNKYE